MLMPKIQFYPLDLQYRVVRDAPIVYIYGRTTTNEQVCVTDASLEPYFYVVPKTREIAELQKKLMELKVDRNGQSISPKRTEIHDRYYIEKPVKAIAVYTKIPADVVTLRNEIKSWEDVEDVTEIDIKFVRRYLIDKGITPMTLCEAEGDFIKQRSKVPIFQAESVKQLSDDDLTKPRVLAFDIETYNPSGKTIDVVNYPILMIAFYGDNFKKVITWKKFKTTKDYISFVDGEAELINEFKEVIDDYKPDVLVGYFSDGFDFPYVKKRANKYKIKLDLGLDYSEVEIVKKQKL